jgi:hypothetical protein
MTDNLRERFPTLERKRKKVAIVGFAATTRHLAPFMEDDWEIWGLNEAHRNNWMRRITRWFQIHKRWDFTKQNGQAYREHWDWLQKKHPFPIYMQEEHDDVPSGIAYPMDEIVDKLLPNVKRTNGDTIKYFTSSFAFMCALAIYEGFETIGAWGFEMATDTEYRYQKGSSEFWLGVAAGRGINVVLPTTSAIMRGAVYGYEVSRMINRQRLEAMKQQWERVRDAQIGRAQMALGKREECDRLFAAEKDPERKKLLMARGNQLLEEQISEACKANLFFGRVQQIDDLIKVVDNMHAGKDDWVEKTDREAEDDLDDIDIPEGPPPAELVGFGG